MSEREFELYLSVLSRLLRLSPAQRAEIADELRDDLESRFLDLCKQGHDRETAIQLAIEELGDASGLANHFTRIARQRRRRLIMRYSLTTAVVMAGVILGLHAFGPNEPGLDGPTVAEAQFGGGGFGGGQFGDAAGGGAGNGGIKANESDNIGIRLFSKPRLTTFRETITIPSSSDSDYPAGLKKKVQIEEEESLTEVLNVLSEETGLPIFVDHKSLEDEGLNAADISLSQLGTITGTDGGLNGWQILNTICRLETTQSIGWHLRNGTVWIRGKSALWEERNLQRTSYDLAQLLETGIEMPMVIMLIQELAGGRWMDIDGDGGTVVSFGTTVTIKTNSHVHQRIGTMLQAVAAHAAKNPPRQTRTPLVEANRKLEEALESGISVAIKDESLDSACSVLEEKYGVACRIDRVALENEGLDPADLTVSIKVDQQPLRVALEWMLEPLDLAIDIADGNVWITTKVEHEESDSGRHVVFYDVREILVDLDDSSELVSTVESVVDGPWLNQDGDGGVISYFPGVLIVRQSRDAHRQIAELLDFYKRSKASQIPAPASATDDSQLELRLYRVNLLSPDSLVKVIPEFVSPGTWNENGGPGSIRAVVNQQGNLFGTPTSYNAVIIRQTRSVHLEISQFLRRMGEHNVQHGGFGSGGFGGGGMGGGGFGGGGFGGGGGFF